MKLFVYGFWSGFIEKINPVNVEFFIDLLSRVFSLPIELGSFEESDILLETIFQDTFLFKKKWKYSFLFSGESKLNSYHNHYTCVLYGQKNHDNIINVPLFIPYLYCTKREIKNNFQIPPKDVCAIISNSGGRERNEFLEKLEKRIRVDYAGSYKNNIEKCEHVYNTVEFTNFIKDYKFIISMENSEGETYITEKITHGFFANTIPIYWGSKNVADYFNEKRFININDQSIDQILELSKNDALYLEMITHPVFTKDSRTIQNIADDIKNLIHKKYEHIQKIFVISSPQFEPERVKRIEDLFSDMGLSPFHYTFMSPTYKHTITDEIMNKHVKQNLVRKLRYLNMKKSEISLFLNYKSVLETICKNYSDGLFLILESDIYCTENINNLTLFIDFLSTQKNWDLVHFGGREVDNFNNYPYLEINPFRQDNAPLPIAEKDEIDQDMSNGKYKLFRKYHTRCTDSFIWTYKGIQKFLNYMNENPYYEAPFDYYMCNFFETNKDFRHYWSYDTFFFQGSNYGLEKSTIQSDIE